MSPPLTMSPPPPPQTTPPYYGTDVIWSVRSSGAGLLISSMCFSMLFQHSVPGLMAAIEPTKRKNVKQVFGYALLTSAGLYIILGVTMAIYFGNLILPSSNLNFVNFNFGMGLKSGSDSGGGYLPSNTTTTTTPLLANMLSYTIVLFPVFGSISVYPLICKRIHVSSLLFFDFDFFYFFIEPTSDTLFFFFLFFLISSLPGITLSNNLHVSTARWTGWSQDDQRAKIIWRLVAAVPPILLSLCVRNLSTIIQFSGIFAVPIAYIFPALLQLFSKRRALVSDENGYDDIPYEYSWHFNQYPCYAWGMIVIGVMCWGLVIVQLVQHLIM